MQGARLGPVALEDAARGRGVVGHADGERMMRPRGEPNHLGFGLGGRGEPAELGKAHDQPEAIVDRCRRDVAEGLVFPFRGQPRHVAGNELSHPLVFATQVVRLLEIARGDDLESQVSQVLGERQRADPGGKRLIELRELRVDVRHERIDTPALAVVVQSLGKALRLTQALQRTPQLAELVQHGP
jgi:hypothetical protein